MPIFNIPTNRDRKVTDGWVIQALYRCIEIITIAMKYRPFHIGGKWDLQDLIDFIPDIYESGLADIKALEKKSKISIEEAKKKYPEWYERRVVRGEGKKRWNVKRDLYDWWLDRIRKEIWVWHD